MAIPNGVSIGPGEKWCPDCKRVLNAYLDFYLMKRWKRDGNSVMVPNGYCKECTKVRQSESRSRLRRQKREWKQRMDEALETYVPKEVGPPPVVDGEVVVVVHVEEGVEGGVDW